MRRSEYSVLVFSPIDGGHHLNFARLVTRAFRQLGVRTVLATTERAQRSRELSSVGVPVLRVSDHNCANRFASIRQQVDDLRRLVQEEQWNRLLIPAGDGLLQALTLFEGAGHEALRSGLIVEALALRGGVAYASSPSVQLKRRVSLSLMQRAPVAIRHHLDPVFLDWVRVQPPPRTAWRLMPDPIEAPPPLDRETARRTLGVPNCGPVIGCVGVLDERKGIDRVVDAFEKATRSRECQLLLVGRCSPGVRTAIARLAVQSRFSGRLHVKDKWASDEDMLAALAAMDLVVAAYPGHVGSASIVLRAMAAGRPVLGSPTPWIARHVQNYAAGWVADAEDADGFLTALAKSVALAETWRPGPAVKELLAYDSPENFMAHWTAATVAELGCESPFVLRSPPGRVSAS